MLTQFDHTLFSSFYLWFDDRLTRVGGAVRTGQSQTLSYYDSEDRPSNFYAFYAEDRQFSANSLIAPSSVYVNGSVVNQATGGTGAMIIDHDQGRVLLSTGYGTGVAVSGNFIEKEVNVYTPNERIEEVLINREFLVSGGQSYLVSTQGLGQNAYTLPAAFLSYDRSENEAFAIGGIDDTRNNIRVMIVSDSNYDCDAVSSLFRDSAHKSFKIIPYSAYPYGGYWHLKNPPYTYTGLANASGTTCSYIEKVSTYKMKDAAVQKIARGLSVAIVDFEISSIRTTV